MDPQNILEVIIQPDAESARNVAARIIARLLREKPKGPDFNFATPVAARRIDFF